MRPPFCFSANLSCLCQLYTLLPVLQEAPILFFIYLQLSVLRRQPLWLSSCVSCHCQLSTFYIHKRPLFCSFTRHLLFAANLISYSQFYKRPLFCFSRKPLLFAANLNIYSTFSRRPPFRYSLNLCCCCQPDNLLHVLQEAAILLFTLLLPT
jgi:hypothetical protein